MAALKVWDNTKSWADMVDEDEELNAVPIAPKPSITPSPTKLDGHGSRLSPPSSTSASSSSFSEGTDGPDGDEDVAEQTTTRAVADPDEKKALDILDSCVLVLATTDMTDDEVIAVFDGLMVLKVQRLYNSKTGAAKPHHYVMFPDHASQVAAIERHTKVDNPHGHGRIGVWPLDTTSFQPYDGQDPLAIRVVGLIDRFDQRNVTSLCKRLEGIFSVYGPVRRVTVHMPKGQQRGRGPILPQIFVTYKHQASSTLAIMFTHNHVEDGRKMTAGFANDRA